MSRLSYLIISGRHLSTITRIARDVQIPACCSVAHRIILAPSDARVQPRTASRRFYPVASVLRKSECIDDWPKLDDVVISDHFPRQLIDAYSVKDSLKSDDLYKDTVIPASCFNLNSNLIYTQPANVKSVQKLYDDLICHTFEHVSVVPDDCYLKCSGKTVEVINKKQSEGGGDERNKLPNTDQLNRMKDFLIREIPGILSKRHEYRIYVKDLIFENNWTVDKPYTTVGLTAYALKLFKARAYVHFRYAKVKVIVISATTDPTAGSVAVRWRVAGLPQMKAFMFWKFVPFKVSSKASEESEWLDGLSTFYVNTAGFIYKHRMDKMMPDKGVEAKVVPKTVLGLQGT